MNAAHLSYCSGREWATVVANELMPWVLASDTLGEAVLELGPGPGLTTDVLRLHAPKLTCLELDDSLARALRRRLPMIDVVRGDAGAMPFASASFATVAIFTMLHHVPSIAQQDQVLAEAHRVIRPNGFIVGSDSIDTPARRDLHVDDVFVPVEPAGLEARMDRVGFVGATVEVRGERILFTGRKPSHERAHRPSV